MAHDASSIASRTTSPAEMPNGMNEAHVMSAEEVAVRHQVQPQTGLGSEAVASRLDSCGPNRLPEMPPRSPWTVLLAQFKSILILILIGAAALAGAIGNVKDAVVILAVVVINALVGFYQEYRAEQSLAALKKMLPASTRVRREGVACKISAEALVPGDIVLLEAGDRVPADGRLWVAAGLEIDESALTGESQPAGKQVAPLPSADVPLGDRSNMAYMNTLLTRGRAELIVTATGPQTEMGRLSAELAAAEEPPTPLQVQLDVLGKRLGVIALTLVGLLAFLEVLRGSGFAHIAIEAIALAVAAMPEGLPVVVTVTLALGMHKMARQRAVVKRLASVETLGCTTVICSDKTGTLTLNQMTARAFVYQGKSFEVSGEGYGAEGAIRAADHLETSSDLTPLLLPLVACNDSQVDGGRLVGDPMEGALVVLAAKAGMSQADVARRLPRIAEVPFDSAHKFMATFHQEGDRVHVYVKGAPDILLGRCTHSLGQSGRDQLSDADRRRMDSAYLMLAQRGLRGLLIAARTIPSGEFDPSGDLMAWTNELTCIGLIGLMDPPRSEAKQAIAECQRAGIAVKMITGDHASTAAAIARELGLEGTAISGADLDRLDSAELASMIDGIAVFARVTPAHKVKIVRALQAKGHVVAMTGDGVNDAPALKRADIGVAMGASGTAVAKEAASMVLTDDNFATIVSAVRQGRVLYDNILKFVRFQLSTTIGAILTVFFAPLAGLPDPFTPIQILWIAIIMDGPPAVSLALDSPRPGIMAEQPRSRSVAILPGARLMRVVGFGVTMMAGTLAVLYYGMHTGSAERALTMAFTTFVLFQFFNLFNARNEIGSAFGAHLFDNRMLWASLAGVVALQAIAVHWPPAQSIFRTSQMSLMDWGVAVGVAASVLILEETRKAGVKLLSRVPRRTPG